VVTPGGQHLLPIGTFRVLMLATLALLHADSSQSATRRNATSDDQADKMPGGQTP